MEASTIPGTASLIECSPGYMPGGIDKDGKIETCMYVGRQEEYNSPADGVFLPMLGLLVLIAFFFFLVLRNCYRVLGG